MTVEQNTGLINPNDTASIHKERNIMKRYKDFENELRLPPEEVAFNEIMPLEMPQELALPPEMAKNSDLAELNGETSADELSPTVTLPEGTAENPEQDMPQSMEERSRYADEDRKKIIEKLRRQEREMEKIMVRMGVQGNSFEERLKNADELLNVQEQKLFEQEIAQEAEKTGIDPTILFKARFADELQDRISEMQWRDKTLAATEYCHAKNPNFFAALSPEDMDRVNMMVKNGFSPQQIYSAYATVPEETQPGISHIKPMGTMKQSGATDIPSDVLAEYERYGIPHSEALSDYRKQVAHR